MKWTKIIRIVDLPYHLANHVIGEHHTPGHRMSFGVIIMAAGVTMAHQFQHFGNPVIALIGDLMGYSIHATGFIPFAHGIENKAKEQPPIEHKQHCQTCIN